ncbi:MAG: hypothetical protein ACFFD2_11535 [Promethearchaeota archaeon]
MSEADETKKLIKKLVIVISNMSETLQSLEEKIILSNRQMANLTKQVEAITSKLNNLDLEVEKEFVKLEKDSSQIQLNIAFQDDLKKIEKELDNVPDEILDNELKKLLDEDKESHKEKKQQN